MNQTVRSPGEGLKDAPEGPFQAPGDAQLRDRMRALESLPAHPMFMAKAPSGAIVMKLLSEENGRQP
ncbi:hypothetical protein [Geodermatophilus sp. SYSU D01176]